MPLDKKIHNEYVQGDRMIVEMVPYEEMRLDKMVDYWTPDKNPKLKWLAWPLFKLLEWMGFHRTFNDEVITFERIVIDRDELAEKIFETMGSMEGIWGRMPSKMYIGRDQMADLMTKPEYAGLVSLHRDGALQGKYYVGGPSRGYYFDIVVIPWMDGMLLI